jgi:hypothetical protein
LDEQTEPCSACNLKPTNPKDQAEASRPPYLGPLVAFVGSACKRYEGRLKYGGWNYLLSGVQSMTYIGAIFSHTIKWAAGEEHELVKDAKTGEMIRGCHHLDGVIESAAILREAQWRKILDDDRPPAMPAQELTELWSYAQETMSNLFRAFGHLTPRHYTIADSAKPQTSANDDKPPASPNAYTQSEPQLVDRCEMCKVALLSEPGVCGTCKSSQNVVKR